MLTTEAAHEQLRGYFDAGWHQKRRDALLALPRETRTPALALLALDADGKQLPADQRTGADRRKALLALARLSDADRARCFEALFGALAPHVEATWQLLARLPYTTGYQRRAFRAPARPDLGRDRHLQWLGSLLLLVSGYPEDILWLARWATHIGRYQGDSLGLLFAAALERSDVRDELFEILRASATGEDEIGSMGRHVPRALLVAEREEGWDLMERMLLAAQRQEGLRQVILESVDEAHPIAFSRMLALIREHELSRFSSVVRAINVWFGYQYEARQRRHVDHTLELAARYLGDEAARADAIRGGTGESCYLALWATATTDADVARDVAAPLVADPDLERRYAAVTLLSQLGLPEAQTPLRAALDDEDLRVAVRALGAVGAAMHHNTDLFEQLERLLPRVPKKAELEPLIWPWSSGTAEAWWVTRAMILARGERPVARLLPYLDQMRPEERGYLVRQLDASRPDERALLLELLGDRSAWVGREVLKRLGKASLDPEEAAGLEGLLRRKRADLRRAILGLLLTQPDPAALASAERLMAARGALQRQAGLELLAELAEAGREPERCREMARAYTETRPDVSEPEKVLLARMIGQDEDEAAPIPTLDDALGLAPEGSRSIAAPPQLKKRLGIFLRKPSLDSEAARGCLKALDALIHEHRQHVIEFDHGYGSREFTLGNFNTIGIALKAETPVEAREKMPLALLWERWWRDRPNALRDRDGLELVRALTPFTNPMATARLGIAWLPGLLRDLFPVDVDLRYPNQIRGILWWLIRLYPPDAADFLLDAVAYSLALLPTEGSEEQEQLWQHPWMGRLMGWVSAARQFRDLCPERWSQSHDVRLWQLLRWLSRPRGRLARFGATLDELLAAYEAGAATESDIYYHLLGPRDGHSWYTYRDLALLTARGNHALVERYPILRDIAERCRARILEIELARGEMPTAASTPALALRAIYGAGTVIRLLQGLGREGFQRGWSSDGRSRKSVFSHLLRASLPAESDSPEEFAARVRAAGLRERRLLELAAYAPQWGAHVEHALGWDGLEDAIWWLHAHTKDSNWRVDQEIRTMWQAQIGEITPLTAQALVDGAVDVAWFHRAYTRLGEERWRALDRAAKYASGGGGHKRAQLFADAMRGAVTADELIERVGARRHQDSVRALGLVPLPEGDERDAEILARYAALQEFAAGSRKFGAQRRASEARAVEIAMENLARTAGYPDPLRLTWAMELEAVRDLTGGALVVESGGVTLTLEVDSAGEPALAIMKGERALKRVPPRIKKEPEVAALLERRDEIRAQARRNRAALEGAMVRGDLFTSDDLRLLTTHPVLAPMVATLLFVSERGIGVPIEHGAALDGIDGEIGLGPGSLLRLAHPTDLLAGGDWAQWQRHCFMAGWSQPFKQIFRELYVITAQEREDGTLSRRYAGHQVNPRQAAALLDSRGWVMHYETGAYRTFHDYGISAHLHGDIGLFTPAEVEGTTLQGVHFARRGEWKPMALVDVPPRLFSEVMRDLDLVVSVAHQGGVDPEASASTIEMRSALLRETLALLRIENVRLEKRHALIQGTRGDYSVHLGSAVVHRQPGGSLCIVPVHQQHRGRLFLPFADDDPRSAEVVSKILLLARDHEIRDPTLLEQL